MRCNRTEGVCVNIDPKNIWVFKVKYIHCAHVLTSLLGSSSIICLFAGRTNSVAKNGSVTERMNVGLHWFELYINPDSSEVLFMMMLVGLSQEIKIWKSKKDLNNVFLNNMPCECGAPAVSYTGNNEASDKQCRRRRRIDNKSILFHILSLPAACAFTYAVFTRSRCSKCGYDIPNGAISVHVRPSLFSDRSKHVHLIADSGSMVKHVESWM